MKLKINDLDHSYYLECTSVSDIVNQIVPFDISEINPDILKKAQDKGTCVHKAAESYVLNGGFGYCCYHNIKAHQKAIDWLFERVDSLVQYVPHCEESIYSSQFNFCGTPDLFFLKEEEGIPTIYVYDYKTGTPKPEREILQLNLYWILIKEKYKKSLKELEQYNVKYRIINTKIKEVYDPTEKVEIDRYEELISNLKEILKGMENNGNYTI